MPAKTELLKYFKDRLLETAAKLQSWKSDESSESDSTNGPSDDVLDKFTSQLLTCTADMSPEEVCLV